MTTTSGKFESVLRSTTKYLHRYLITNSAQTKTWPGQVCVRVLQPPWQPSRGGGRGVGLAGVPCHGGS